MGRVSQTERKESRTWEDGLRNQADLLNGPLKVLFFGLHNSQGPSA